MQNFIDTSVTLKDQTKEGVLTEIDVTWLHLWSSQRIFQSYKNENLQHYLDSNKKKNEKTEEKQNRCHIQEQWYPYGGK